ncbi:hypothetical protein CASFOL_034270 [Castilleja foliolosa]|uniref:Uncharacterized protein n=1 Tax=Castilleja foliolosa TaxID=1961234 RepID=A0ABD3BYB6_9LAMI
MTATILPSSKSSTPATTSSTGTTATINPLDYADKPLHYAVALGDHLTLHKLLRSLHKLLRTLNLNGGAPVELDLTRRLGVGPTDPGAVTVADPGGGFNHINGYQFYRRQPAMALLPNGQPIFLFDPMVRPDMAAAYRLNQVGAGFPSGGAWRSDSDTSSVVDENQIDGSNAKRGLDLDLNMPPPLDA